MTDPQLGLGAGVAALSGLALAHALPTLTAVPRVRSALAPRLAGRGGPNTVALTFDDGPHPVATPRLLRLLDDHGVRATFFLVGEAVLRAPGLAAELAAAGHEIALHGQTHRCLLWRTPRATYDDLARGRDTVAHAVGSPPRWYRPPYGVLTTAAIAAVARLDLTPVLWTNWGRDWTARATPASVVATLTRRLAPGATLLLHDNDAYAAPGSWAATLGAVPLVLDAIQAAGLSPVGLSDHMRR